jgi:hypothetical protein
MMPTKSQLMTIGYVFAMLWAINNIDALEPLKDQLKG